MHAIVHGADIQDRDGGALLMATLFGAFPFLLNCCWRSTRSRRASTALGLITHILRLDRCLPPFSCKRDAGVVTASEA
jgi:hypothetical protein